MVVEQRSRITAKGQTTVPKAVRQALGVTYGGEIAFRLDEHGVSVRSVQSTEADPVIAAFLTFLERSMERHPQVLTPFPAELLRRAKELTADTEIDPNDPIDGPVDL